MKYLSSEQLLSLLKAGKPVEQWLGYDDNSEYVAIKWLRIDREKDGTYSIAFFEVFDEGSVDMLDVYEFSPIDPDLPYGQITTFSTYTEALNFAYSEYNCVPNQFVSAGLIQDEYRQYIESERR